MYKKFIVWVLERFMDRFDARVAYSRWFTLEGWRVRFILLLCGKYVVITNVRFENGTVHGKDEKAIIGHCTFNGEGYTVDRPAIHLTKEG